MSRRSQSAELTIGYSPCPNDTFIFHGLVHRVSETYGLRFSEPMLEDVETLNMWALERRLDVTKLSFHALGYVLEVVACYVYTAPLEPEAKKLV